jgi:hypothetical protein
MVERMSTCMYMVASDDKGRLWISRCLPDWLAVACGWHVLEAQIRAGCWLIPFLSTYTLFAWLISHQPAVLSSQNKPATSQQYFYLRTNQHQPSATSHTICDPTRI